MFFYDQYWKDSSNHKEELEKTQYRSNLTGLIKWFLKKLFLNGINIDLRNLV